MTEVNITLASGHFKNGGAIIPTLDFWRQLSIKFMKNTIGKEPVCMGRPILACRRPQIVEFQMKKVATYRGYWLTKEKIKISKKKYKKQCCKNHSECIN